MARPYSTTVVGSQSDMFASNHPTLKPSLNDISAWWSLCDDGWQPVVLCDLRWTGLSVSSGQVEPMHGISYDTAFEVALSTGFILYHILRACIAAEPLRGHLSSGCGPVEVRSFSSLCNQGQSADWLVHKAIFHCGRRYICGKYILIITLRYINVIQVLLFLYLTAVGSTFLDKMVAWNKSNPA
jgi:hypothetical protein